MTSAIALASNAPERYLFHGSRPGSRSLDLGLFITKQIVVAHGGTVDVDTSDAAGTTFISRLPRRANLP